MTLGPYDIEGKSKNTANDEQAQNDNEEAGEIYRENSNFSKAKKIDKTKGSFSSKPSKVLSLKTRSKSTYENENQESLEDY